MSLSSLRGIKSLVPAAILAVCGGASGVLADEVRVVVTVGDTLNAGAASVQIADINLANTPILPVVGESGHVAFAAVIRGTGVSSSNNQTLWVRPPQVGAQAYLVARTQMAAPRMLANQVFAGFASPRIDNAGSVSFWGTMTGPGLVAGVNNRGYWCANGPGNYQVLVQEGAIDSQTNLIGINEVEFPAADEDRALAFRSAFSGSGVTHASDVGLWFAEGRSERATEDHAQRTQLSREGSPVEGMSGVNWGDLHAVVNPSGAAAAYGNLTGQEVGVRGYTNGTPSTDQGLWRVLESSMHNVPRLQLLTRAGEQAEGAGGRVFYTLFNSTVKPQVTASGTVAFAASLVTTGNVAAGSGVWTRMGGVTRLVALGSDAAPECGQGVNFGSMFSPFSFQHVFACDAVQGGSEKVLFIAPLTGSGVTSGNNRMVVLYDSSNGTRRQILRGGDSVPRGGQGVTVVAGSIGPTMRVNRSGDFVANVQLAGSGISVDNDRAIVTWVNGTLRTSAREGDVVPESGGLTILSISSSATPWLNNLGQVVFGAEVRPGSGGLSSNAMLRVDENGNLRVLTSSAAPVVHQSGPSLRYGPVVTSGCAFSDGGHFAFVSDLMPGGQVSGRSIVSIRIVAEPSTPLVGCVADTNRNGVVSEQDLFDFLTAWFSGRGDFDGNGTTSVEDVFGYIAAWFEPC